jgi:hypothetical protein
MLRVPGYADVHAYETLLQSLRLHIGPLANGTEGHNSTKALSATKCCGHRSDSYRNDSYLRTALQ